MLTSQVAIRRLRPGGAAFERGLRLQFARANGGGGGGGGWGVQRWHARRRLAARGLAAVEFGRRRLGLAGSGFECGRRRLSRLLSAAPCAAWPRLLGARAAWMREGFSAIVLKRGRERGEKASTRTGVWPKTP